MKRAQVLIPFGLGLLLVIGFVWGFRAVADCPTYPYDVSRVLQLGNVDNCGDTHWELEARYGAYIYDEGEYDATGTCTGGYRKCDCTNVPVSYKTLTKSFVPEFVSDTEHIWSWNITNYYERVFNNCTSGSCQSTGYASETDFSEVDPSAGWDDETYTDCIY